MADKHTLMNSYSVADIEEVLSKLSGGFIWAETDEGHLYWAQVHDRLRTMATVLKNRDAEED